MNLSEVITERHSTVMAEAWLQCDQFNRKHPVGTKVQYRSLLDRATQWDVKETRTRSQAWALPSGEPVVMIDGKSGSVSLNHIEAKLEELR